MVKYQNFKTKNNKNVKIGTYGKLVDRRRSKYTVTVNHDEYAVGIYDKESDAESYVARRLKQDEPDVTDDMTITEILEFNTDGYYRILEIQV